MDETTFIRRMVDQTYRHNARHLLMDFQWLRQVVATRYQLFHGKPCQFTSVEVIPLPILDGHPSPYQEFIEVYQLDWTERLVLLLAIFPQIYPHLLNEFWQTVNPQLVSNRFDNEQSELPNTVETALFLLAGDDLEKRLFYQQLFEPDAFLLQNKVIFLENKLNDFSPLQAYLGISPDFLALFTTGKPFQPTYSHNFPAQRITTEQDWRDLVLDAKTASQISEIELWIKYEKTILYDWELKRKLSPGYKCLFHGPPGTGKTLTASLLGKRTGRDVYRVDLSMVVSKYIGETEKSLRRIFDMAARKPWILFFDEAEALFSKRTEVQDAHDRFANQEISYLLYRLEEHSGIVILATNKKNLLDEAFTRRFQSVVSFSLPSKKERLKIWQQGFSPQCALEKAINLETIANQYELAGGSIMNVIRYASLMALKAGGNVIMLKDIIRGIQREYSKEGKSI